MSDSPVELETEWDLKTAADLSVNSSDIYAVATHIPSGTKGVGCGRSNLEAIINAQRALKKKLKKLPWRQR